MKGVGLLYHFTFLSIEFAKRLRNTKFSFLMVSEKGEQNEGLWNLIHDQLEDHEYLMTESHNEFNSIVSRYLEDGSYDHVIYLTQGLVQFTSAIKLKRKFKERLKLYIRLNSFKHGTIYRPALSFIYSFIFCKYGDAINFQCPHTITKFTNSKLITRKGIDVIIPLGLNDPDIIADSSKLDLNSIFEDEEAYKIIYLAQFHKHKRHLELVNSLMNLLKSNNNIKLILFGSGSELDRIKELVKQEKLTHQVIFAGRVDRKFIPYYLSKSNLSVVLSKIETFGHNILEPLFYNIPVISTDTGIASDVIKDFQNGFVLRANKFSKLSKLVKVFHKADNSTFPEDCVSNYTWKNTVDSYINMFHYLTIDK